VGRGEGGGGGQGGKTKKVNLLRLSEGLRGVKKS